MMLTNRHALCAVESFFVFVIETTEVHAHIEDFFFSLGWAARAQLCFVKPIGLLGDIRRLHRVNMLIEPKDEELIQEFFGFWCGQRVVSMIHI